MYVFQSKVVMYVFQPTVVMCFNLQDYYFNLYVTISLDDIQLFMRFDPISVALFALLYN